MNPIINMIISDESLSFLLQLTISGITLGAVYGIIAIGYTMVYGIIGMINFAHGEIYMIASFIALIGFTLCNVLGIGYVPLAIILVMLASVFFTALYGWTVERVAYRPLRSAPRLAPLISAIGMSIFLQNAVQLLQGAREKSIPPIIDGSISIFEIESLGVRLSLIQFIVVVVTLVVMAAFTFMINRTAFGRSQRACEQDRLMASLLGLNVDRIISLTFVSGAALAAVAGEMVPMYYGSVNFYIGFLAGMKAFTAAVLGGIGSLPGAMLGGLVIGLVESWWAGYVSSEYKDVAAFTVLILVLIFRPSGLLGKPEIEKV
ncbi:MAG: branched-chain amino acid ABC transporter permease LivH [Alphaproteobacteria bacterium]|nr:branched-chain amino acid ABC transporter permease LivH [Alphaproteobacteria bacterium]